MRHQRLLPLLLASTLAAPAPAAAARLYWFVPDGLRADPVFDVFRWAQEGELPNIKALMDRGAWGYSMPAFPSHTPANFATLMTGAYPEAHGVADGPMREPGRPLGSASVNGFASTSKRLPPVWRDMEEAGLKVALISVPGSTPPELDSGWTLRGRWSGWGAEFHAVNFETLLHSRQRYERGADVRLFFQGPELTRHVPLSAAGGWPAASPQAYGELTLSAYGATFYALVEPDGVSVALDKGRVLARLLDSNQWTDWFQVTLRWRGQEVATRARVGLIKRGPGAFAKLRLLVDSLNRTIVQPAELADSLSASLGPMVDFPDNWPAQLNRLPEERAVFLTEASWALDWHRRAAGHLLRAEKPDVLIQDTYVPNQMLESRWWLKHLDPASPDYAATSTEERQARLREVLDMYRGIDAVIGEAVKSAGPDTLIALSSDHGILALKKEVLVNNLLAREGLLSFSIDPATGEPAVDWARSRAVFLKMIGIYVHPDGLAGPWTRGSGPQYEALRRRVRGLVSRLRDGETPVAREVLDWERADRLRLPQDRLPDLVLSMEPGYALTEDMDGSGEPLRAPLQSGYKQSVEAEGSPALWTPFVVAGPGVRPGFRLPRPIHNADQAPTLMTLLGLRPAPHVQGRVVSELLR